MPFSTKYLFVVSMDVDADKEELFNEVYDTEHVPLITQVPGVRAASRIVGQDFTMQLAGQTIPKPHEGARYTAIYEIDSPSVLLSPEWAKFAEQGRWPNEVRPYTHELMHFNYSTDWSQGGPIIERERLDIYGYDGENWCANDNLRATQYGPTPLVAAMRCYVASRLGNEVEVPEGLE